MRRDCIEGESEKGQEMSSDEEGVVYLVPEAYAGLSVAMSASVICR